MSVRRTPGRGTSGQLPGTLHGPALDFKPGCKPPLDPANTAGFNPETGAELEGAEARKDDLYENVQLQYSLKIHKEADDSIKKLGGNFRNDRQEESANRRLANAKRDVKGVDYWMNRDYSTASVKPADELFNANHGKLDHRVGTDLENTPEPYPIFDSAWSVWYPDREDPDYKDNTKTQTALLDHTYKKYVGENTQSKVVQKWTKEKDDSGHPAPHQIMEELLLRAAGLHNEQKDGIVFTNEGVGKTTSLIKSLYNLVTQAPRCPVMMSFVRTVIFETRLPNDWFQRKHGRKMAAGDSVVLPVFMSTSNMDISKSWDAHGPYSLGVQSDTRQPTENCCVMQVIVSKGTPMLPLGDFESNKDHAHENEILLPPGIELVYLGDDVFDFHPVEFFVGIHTFITRV